MHYNADDSLTLRQLLERAPALSTRPIGSELMDRSLNDFTLKLEDPPPTTPLYLPPGLTVRPVRMVDQEISLVPSQPRTPRLR